MLVMNRATGALRDASFAEFPSLLNHGDLLVLNDTRVIPARLYAHRTIVREREKPTGRVEVMLTEPVAPQMLGAPSFPRSPAKRVGNHKPHPVLGENLWRALVHPGKKVRVGEILVFPSPSGSIELEAEVLERNYFGARLLRFNPVEDFFAVLDRIGHTPLPPYIRRDDVDQDRERYQTVFSRERGSVAAPTAGLHFTPQILDALAARGVEIARLTLHVGLGTFASLRVETVDKVRLHSERYTLSAAAADAVNRAAAEGRRIVAVGTTVVRTLEHCALQAVGNPSQTPLRAHSGETEIFISPGFNFRLVSALLTNFHLPKSSLLMLVSAFAGREPVLTAYSHAVQQKYRFFSYGDCMFLT
jgi:S-adenosylmethionine:tRNA ribosyltransferase-isomerase